MALNVAFIAATRMTQAMHTALTLTLTLTLTLILTLTLTLTLTRARWSTRR